MLRVHALSKSYGPIRAVSDVSFSLKPGTITIMAGADGAGKSTLLKIILGLVRKDSGKSISTGSPWENNLTESQKSLAICRKGFPSTPTSVWKRT